MKVLTVLGLVQTIILLFLLGKIVLFEEETTVAGHAEQSTLVSDDLTNTQSQSNSSDTYIYPDEDRLRQIIREELGAQLDGRSRLDKQMDPVVVVQWIKPKLNINGNWFLSNSNIIRVLVASLIWTCKSFK